MYLASLTVTNVRILACAELGMEFDLVVFSGLNGSGKTSLLEAIHLLGRGQSFRSKSMVDVVSRGEEELVVRGGLRHDDGHESSVGVRKRVRGSPSFLLSGEKVRTASALARHLPMVLITPESQRMLSDGADVRRRLLDWVMFHVEPEYHSAFQRFRRALRQRNAMLRVGATQARERLSWCAELGAAAEAVNRLRRQRLGQALPLLEDVLRTLSRVEVSIEFHPGWDEQEPLERLLMLGWERDLARGFTGVGPHRADLAFRVCGRPAQQVVSRGEGKVITVGVLVGLARLLAETVGRRPLLLVDELASELDAENRARFFAALRATGAQTFVTTISEDLVDATGWSGVDTFRLARGKVRKVLQ